MIVVKLLCLGPEGFEKAFSVYSGDRWRSVFRFLGAGASAQLLQSSGLAAAGRHYAAIEEALGVCLAGVSTLARWICGCFQAFHSP